MMENNKEYWLLKAKIKDKYLQKNLATLEKKLKKVYKDSLKEIKKELAYLESTGQLEEWQRAQLEGTIASIEKILDNKSTSEEQLLNDHLEKTIKDVYEKEAYNVGMDALFHQVNDNTVREILKTNWSGLTFSERIWDSRRKLATKVKEIMTKGIIRGDSLQDMARTLADEMNKDYNRALTLMHTETCWVQCEATVQSYKDAGLTSYEYMAFLDSKTTKICRELDGKVFKLEEAQAGVNMPPMHPRCRSTITPYLDDYVINPEKDGNNPSKKKAKEPVKPKTYKKYTLSNADDIVKENDFISRLNKDEKRAINEYTTSAYSKINNLLRGKYKGETKEKFKNKYTPTINNISKALRKAKAHDNIMVYRGTTPSIFKGYLTEKELDGILDMAIDLDKLNKKVKGLIIEDKGFMSTTVNSNGTTAESFAGGILLEIKVDKGATGGAYIAPISKFKAEGEWLLDKGTKLQIEEITMDKDTEGYKIICRYIDPKELEG